MKIAILYICTGEYSCFWDAFYRSAETYFCRKSEKHYFVFTDSNQISSVDRITVLHQDNFGWPLNTLYRYRAFLRLRESLFDYDWVVFFNANCEFKMEIDELEFFGEDKSLLACIHPGYYNKDKDRYPYEKRTESTAYVENYVNYFPGGLMGGKPEPFMSVCAQLKDNIETDFDHGIMAIWHDESHWNAYINNNFESLSKNLQVLSPSYLYPEGWAMPFAIKIMLRDKQKTIDVVNIKGLYSERHSLERKAYLWRIVKEIKRLAISAISGKVI